MSETFIFGCLPFFSSALAFFPVLLEQRFRTVERRFYSREAELSIDIALETEVVLSNRTRDTEFSLEDISVIPQSPFCCPVIFRSKNDFIALHGLNSIKWIESLIWKYVSVKIYSSKEPPEEKENNSQRVDLKWNSYWASLFPHLSSQTPLSSIDSFPSSIFMSGAEIHIIFRRIRKKSTVRCQSLQYVSDVKEIASTKAITYIYHFLQRHNISVHFIKNSIHFSEIIIQLPPAQFNYHLLRKIWNCFVSEKISKKVMFCNK